MVSFHQLVLVVVVELSKVFLASEEELIVKAADSCFVSCRMACMLAMQRNKMGLDETEGSYKHSKMVPRI